MIINAPSGLVSYSGFDEVQIISSFGEAIIESINSNITINADGGTVSMQATEVSFAGNFNNGGVHISSNNELDFITSSYGDVGQSVDVSGRDIMIGGNGIFVESNADMYFYAQDRVEIDSDGAMNLGASNLFEILSLSGPMNVDANHLNVEALDFRYEATGSLSIASVLGHINLNGQSSVDVHSDDQVKFTSVDDGILINAGGDINFDAGDTVSFSSSSPDETASWLTSNSIQLDSTLDEVEYHANTLLMINTDDFSVNANQDGFITSQGNFVVDAAGTIQHDINRNIIISATRLVQYDSGNGSINMDIDDDLFIITDSLIDIEAPGLQFTIDDDVDIEIQSDFDMHANNNMDIDFSSRSTISGEFELNMHSTGDITLNTDDIDMVSGHSVYFMSDASADFTAGDDIIITAPVFSEFRASGYDFTGSSDFSIFAQGGFNLRTETLNAGANEDIDILVALDMAIVSDDFTVNTLGDIELSTIRDYHISGNDLFSFIATGDVAGSSVNFAAGDNIYIESGEAFTATGDDVDFDVTNELHIYARDDLRILTTADIEVDVNGPLDLTGTNTVSIQTSGQITFDAATDLLIDSTVLYHNDIFFQTTTTGGSINLNPADDFDILTHRFEATANNAINFDVTTFTINHQEAPTDFGRIIFNSNEGNLDLSSSTYDINARTTEFYAENNINLSSSGAFTVTTFNNNDIDFYIASDFTSTAGGETSITSNQVDIFADESASLIGTNVALSGNTFNAHVEHNAAFSASDEFDWTYSNFLWAPLKSFTVSTGPLDVNAGDLEILAGGSGFSAIATGKVTLSGLNIRGTVDEHLTLQNNNSPITMDSVGNMHFTGGAHTISANSSISYSAFGNIIGNSDDNGFLNINSGANIKSTSASQYFIQGFVSDLTEENGRYGDIRSTAMNADICIRSNNVGTTGFSGDSISWSAFGPSASLMASSVDSMTMSSTEGSVGMSAYGFVPTDPQFLFDEDQTFGILYRTAPGNPNGIAITSARAISAYSEERFLMSANTSTIAGFYGGDLDFRTYAKEANIDVLVANGNIVQTFESDSEIRTGNPLLPADLLVSATRDIMWDAAGSASFTHLGTSTDENNLGILFESFDDMTYTATVDFDVRALDNGIVDIETRGGDMTFIATGGDNQFRADTGSINMIVRGEATLNAATRIDIAADGDGGSVFLSSGNEKLFSVVATDFRFFVTADQGEIDFEATTGFDVTAGDGIDFSTDNGETNIEGGSVLFNALTSISFESEEDLGLDADVQFTIDSLITDVISIEGISLSAGGNGITNGITVTSVGDISYDSSDDMVSFESLRFTSNAANTLSVLSNSDIAVESSSGSILDNSITLSAPIGEMLMTSLRVNSKASERHSILVNGPSTINAISSITVLSLSGDINLDVARETELTLLDSSIAFIGNMYADIGGDYVWTATDDIEIRGDSNVEFTGTGQMTVNVFDMFISNLSRIGGGDTTISSVGVFSVSTEVSDISMSSAHGFDVFGVGALSFTSLADDVILQVIDEIDILARNSVSKLAATTYTFLGQAQNFMNDDFSASQLNLEINFANFDSYSFDDFGVTATDILLQTTTNQPFIFEATTDIEVTGDVTSYTSVSNRILFNAVELQPSGSGIDIDAVTLVANSPTGDISFRSKRDIILDSNTEEYITDFLTLTSYGQNGVFIEADTQLYTIGVDTSYETMSGNIEMYGNTVAIDANVFDITSHGQLTDIVFEATTNNFNGATITFSQYSPDALSDSTQSGYGKIEMWTDSFTLLSGSNLDINSDSDAVITATGASYSGPQLNLSGGNLVDLISVSGISVTAPSFEFAANGVSTLPLEEISILSNNVALSAETISSTTSSTIDFHSAGYIAMFGTTSTFTTPSDVTVTADTGRIALTGLTLDISAVDLIRVTATGNEGLLDIGGTGGTLTATNWAFRAGDSIHAPLSSITSGSLEITSGSDVYFDSPSIGITSTSSNIFSTSNDGNFIVRSGGDITYTSGSDINLNARGMLGTLGGRYVIDDFYFNRFYALDQSHRINRNTNGIEVVNVNGDLDLLAGDFVYIDSTYASIEFRAQETIRYFVPNAGGRVLFFGIPAIGTNGIHKAVPIPVFSNDYCNVAGGCDPSVNCGSSSRGCPGGTCTVNCPEISQVLNDIVRAMVAYGLLQCDNGVNGAPFCF